MFIGAALYIFENNYISKNISVLLHIVGRRLPKKNTHSAKP